MTTAAPTALLEVALFGSSTDNKPIQKLLPWPKIVTNLCTHIEREEKDGMLFSPTLYKKGMTRKKANVQRVSMLVLDFDDGTRPDQLTPAWVGYEHLIYSTFSHTPEKPKWRAVFPLREPVAGAGWPAAYRRMVTALGQGHTDPACSDASRIYYLPSCPPDADRFADHHEGEWITPELFPEVAAPEPSKPAMPAVTPIALSNGRVTPETLIERALERTAEGRNTAGLWLACQLRDNRYTQDEAQRWIEDYQARVPDTGEPYTMDEALHSVDQAYGSAPREAWETPRPFSLNGAAPANLAESLETARAAVDAAKTDPGAPFAPDALQALAAVRRWDPANWARLQAELRKRGTIRDLERALESKTAPEAPPAERLRYAGDMLEACPFPELVIPSPYVLQEHRTGRFCETEQGSGVMTLAMAPLGIAGRAKDTLSGQELLLLVWKHVGSEWQFRIVDRSGAICSKKLPDLADVGFPYLEERAKDLANYLARIEAANRLTLPCARISSHLGWQGKPDEEAPFLCGTTLVLPDGEADTATTLNVERPDTWTSKRVMFHGTGEGEQQIVAAYHAAGRMSDWKATIRELVPFDRIMAMFYAGFAPPLLEVLRVTNFAVDMSHATTTGKTTALRAAGSIWGNPDDRASSSVVGTWSNSRTYIERAAHVLSGVPLILDDTKRARKPEDVADGLYSVAQGRGRGRGTIKGIALTSYWRTVLLSSGEQPATSYTQDGGTRARVLTIRGLPFGRRDPETGQFAQSINTRLCEHYGHAGLAFICWLMKNRDQWEKWQALYTRWVSAYAQKPPIAESGRIAQYAALVTVAGFMAHEALALPWEYTNPLVEIWPDIIANAADAAGEERALRDVISWAHSHERTFYGRTEQDMFGREKSLPVEVSGRWDKGEDWEFIAFYPTVLRKILTDHGYHAESVFVGWRDRDWLECIPSRFTKRVRVSPDSTPQMIVITRAAINSLEEEKETGTA